MRIEVPLDMRLYADIEFVNYGDLLKVQLEKYIEAYGLAGLSRPPLGYYKPVIRLDKSNKTIILESHISGTTFVKLHFDSKKLAEMAFDLLKQEKALWNLIITLSKEYERYLKEQLVILEKWKNPEGGINED